MNQTVERKLDTHQLALSANEPVKHGGDGRGKFDNLLTLASSVVLLESEGQRHTEKLPDGVRGIHDVPAKISPRIQAKLRVTQIRRQARLKRLNVNHRQEQPDLKKFEDLCVIAKLQTSGIECIRKEASITKFLKNYNERFQQPSVQTNGIIPQPVQMAAKPGELTGHQTGAQQLIHVKNIHGHASMNYHRGRSVEQTLHAENNSRLTARYYRMVRMLERRKRRFPKQLEGKSDVETTPRDGVQFDVQTTLMNGVQSDVQETKMDDVQPDAPVTQVNEVQSDVQAMEVNGEQSDVKAMEINGVKSDVQMKHMNGVQQLWMWYMMNPQIGQDLAKQYWESYMSYVCKEHRLTAAQRRRVRRFEEQRPFKSLHQHINTHHPIEQSHFQEGHQQSYLGTGPEQVAHPVEVKESFQHPIITKRSEDQRGKLQQEMTNEEFMKKLSSVKQQMRLTQLKREARLNKTSQVEKIDWKKRVAIAEKIKEMKRYKETELRN